MKYLLLLLFTFSAYAQFKIEYTETSTGGKYEFSKNSEVKAKERLLKIIKKSRWMQGEWKTEVSDLSKTQLDLEGTETTLYYHPTNFTYIITDISQEIVDKEAEKQAAKAARQELRALKQTINDSDLPNWHKKLLKYIIKEIRE